MYKINFNMYFSYRELLQLVTICLWQMTRTVKPLLDWNMHNLHHKVSLFYDFLPWLCYSAYENGNRGKETSYVQLHINIYQSQLTFNCVSLWSLWAFRANATGSTDVHCIMDGRCRLAAWSFSRGHNWYYLYVFTITAASLNKRK